MICQETKQECQQRCHPGDCKRQMVVDELPWNWGKPISPDLAYEIARQLPDDKILIWDDAHAVPIPLIGVADVEEVAESVDERDYFTFEERALAFAIAASMPGQGLSPAGQCR